MLGSLVQRVINWGIGLLGYLAYRRMRAGLPAEAPAADELAAAEA